MNPEIAKMLLIILGASVSASSIYVRFKEFMSSIDLVVVIVAMDRGSKQHSVETFTEIGEDAKSQIMRRKV